MRDQFPCRSELGDATNSPLGCGVGVGVGLNTVMDTLSSTCPNALSSISETPAEQP